MADGGTTDLVQPAGHGDGHGARVRRRAVGRADRTRPTKSSPTPKVEPTRFVPLSSAEAVLRYWSDFIPSWAGAISIDLLPVVLVLVLMIVL